jgi:hypothetical protein
LARRPCACRQDRVRDRRIAGRNRAGPADRAVAHFDEAKTLEVVQASPDRVTPRCPHFGTCGGCVLQHLAEDKQIEAKQGSVLLDNLQRIGHVTPQSVLPPLRGDSWGYRRKGRFSVRRVEKKDKTLVGFREQDPRFVADIGECHVVVPQLGFKVAALGALVDGLDARRDIPQIEFIAGDAHVALVFRHLQPLSDADKARLDAFGTEHGFTIFLQPGGIDSVHPLSGEAPQLSFRLPQWDIELLFRPLDFIQVNAKLNEAMIARALDVARRADPASACSTCSAASATSPCRWRARRRWRCRGRGGRGRAGATCPRECRAQRPHQRAFPCRGPDPGSRIATVAQGRLRQAAAGSRAFGRDRCAEATAVERLEGSSTSAATRARWPATPATWSTRPAGPCARPA